MYLISTSFAEHLAKKIKEKTKDFKVVFPDLNKEGKRYFPDGEIYMKLPPKIFSRAKRVIVLHSGAPKPNEGLVELELILQILKDQRLKSEVFFSYFPYGMQDRVFERGETNVSKNLIDKLVRYYRVKRIWIVDPHFKGREWLKKYPVESLSAIPLLMERARKDFGEDILFLTPDEGGKRRYKIEGFKKVRKGSRKIEISLPKRIAKMIKGKVVGIVDDVLKTGTTLLKVYKEAKKWQPKKMISLVAHGVLKEGILKVKRKYFRLYLTNSLNIAQKGEVVDITDLILKAIKNDRNRR